MFFTERPEETPGGEDPVLTSESLITNPKKALKASKKLLFAQHSSGLHLAKLC